MTVQSSDTLLDVMRNALGSLQNSMNICLPAKVISYDRISQAADIELQIQRYFTDGSVKTIPVIKKVPVQFTSTMRSTISMPLVNGDTGIVIFSQRSLDVWLESSLTTPVNPLDRRKNDINDAIFIPGVFQYGRATTDPSKFNLTTPVDSVIIKHNIGKSSECDVSLSSTGAIKSQNNLGNSELKADGDIDFTPASKVTINGDLNVTGEVTADSAGAGVTLTGHTHAQPSDGGGDAEAETNSPTSGT